MNLNNNIILIIIGVIGLGLSLWVGGGLGVMTILAGSRENLEHIQEMMGIAVWSAVFFVAMIGLGIYNNWRR
jgi:hypothetical protein